MIQREECSKYTLLRAKKLKSMGICYPRYETVTNSMNEDRQARNLDDINPQIIISEDGEVYKILTYSRSYMGIVNTYMFSLQKLEPVGKGKFKSIRIYVPKDKVTRRFKIANLLAKYFGKD